MGFYWQNHISGAGSRRVKGRISLGGKNVSSLVFARKNGLTGDLQYLKVEDGSYAKIDSTIE